MRINGIAAVKENRRFIQYALIGLTGVALDMVAFLLLTDCLAVPYLAANALSVSLGITNNFFWNAFYNFQVKDRLFARFVRFYAIGLFGLALSSGLLFGLVQFAAVGATWAKLLTVVVVALIQFYLNKTITFMNMEQRHA
jgi:Predicted membrane protein